MLCQQRKKLLKHLEMFIGTPESLLLEVKWTPYRLQVELGTVTLTTEWYFDNTPQLPTYICDTYTFIFFFFMCLAFVSFHMTIGCVKDVEIKLLVWRYRLWKQAQIIISSSPLGVLWLPAFWCSTYLKRPIEFIPYFVLSQIVLDIRILYKIILTLLVAPWHADITRICLCLSSGFLITMII